MAVAKAHFDDPAAARVEAVLRWHRAQLLWIARRWSGSADDAEDALQRALEIYVRRLDSLDPATEFAWLKVVKFRVAPTEASAGSFRALPCASGGRRAWWSEVVFSGLSR